MRYKKKKEHRDNGVHTKCYSHEEKSVFGKKGVVRAARWWFIMPESGCVRARGVDSRGRFLMFQFGLCGSFSSRSRLQKLYAARC